jgi:hypothetical protein
MYVHRIGSQRRKALNQPFRAGACTGPRPGVIGSGDEMVVHAMDCEIFFLLAGLQDGYLRHRGRGRLGNLNDGRPGAQQFAGPAIVWVKVETHLGHVH